MDAYEQTPDGDLVALSLKDREAFGYLIRRYQEPIRRYVRRISAFSDDLISDVVQNTFIKAYINLNSFDQTLRFSSWLYRIAHNETISYLRKNKRHIEATLLPDDSLEEFLGDIDIERDHAQQADSDALWQAIRGLKQHYQDVVVLKYFEHKSYDEIADIIEKPPGTVATWISRAKQDIRKNLLANNYSHHA